MKKRKKNKIVINLLAAKMPRCYTIKKINAQQQSIQQYCTNNIGGRSGSGRGCTANDDGDDNDENGIGGGNNKNNTNTISRIGNKTKNATDYKIRIKGKNNSRTVANSATTSGTNGEWKTTAVQRKKLLNTTRAIVQQQCKDDDVGPTSPTEATVAPIYYNSNAHETKTGKLVQT